MSKPISHIYLYNFMLVKVCQLFCFFYYRGYMLLIFEFETTQPDDSYYKDLLEIAKEKSVEEFKVLAFYSSQTVYNIIFQFKY